MKIKLFVIAVLLLNIQHILEEKIEKDLAPVSPIKIVKKEISSRRPANLPGDSFITKIQTPPGSAAVSGDLELEEGMTVKLVPASKQN